MSGARVTIDGLWQCLCPSIDAAILTKALRAPHRPQWSPQNAAKTPSSTKPRQQKRPLCASTRRFQPMSGKEEAKIGEDPFAAIQTHEQRHYHAPQEWDKPEKPEEPRPSTGEQEEQEEPIPGIDEYDKSSPPLQTRDDPHGDSVSVRWPTATKPKDTLLNMSPPYTKLALAPNEAVYEALRKVRDLERLKWRKMTADFVKHLLLVQGDKPNTFMYETLLMAHSSTEGSADSVRALLKEMRDAKIQWSSTAYHSALRAFAIHPDYMARNMVIDEMKEKWIEMTPEGHQYVAIGLLRDGQYELALEKLDEMIRNGVEVSTWVFDVFVYVFARLEFFDDALKIVRHRLERDSDNISVNIWYFLLAECSKGQHLEATKYVWNRAVQPRILTPSDGIALNVLNTASRHGDSKLATQVIQYLSDRGTTLELHHYEALADCYANDGDVEHAFDVFFIMQNAGIQPVHGSAGSVHQSLKRNPALIDGAIKALFQQNRTNDLPISLFNAVLSATLTSSTIESAEARNMAMDLYRRVRELRSKPDLQTFLILLRNCSRLDVADFLEAELRAFKLKMTRLIHQEFLRIYADGGAKYIQKAKWHFWKMMPSIKNGRSDSPLGSREWGESMKIVQNLLGVLLRNEDPEVWRVIEACRAQGFHEKSIQRILSAVAEEKEELKKKKTAIAGVETILSSFGTAQEMSAV